MTLIDETTNTAICESCADHDHLACDQPAETSQDSFGVIDIVRCCCGETL